MLKPSPTKTAKTVARLGERLRLQSEKANKPKGLTLSPGAIVVISPDTFIAYFRIRHRWWCRPGSAIFKDLTAVALEQEASPDSAEELYVIFCTLHGIKP